MGQQLWATSENQKNPLGWTPTSKAQPETFLLINFLLACLGEEAEATGDSHLLFPSTRLALQLRIALCSGGLGQQFSISPGHLLESVLPCLR